MITRGGARGSWEGVLARTVSTTKTVRSVFVECVGLVCFSVCLQTPSSDSLPVCLHGYHVMEAHGDSKKEDGGIPDESSQRFIELFCASRNPDPRRSSLSASHRCPENAVVGSDRGTDRLRTQICDPPAQS